MEVKDPSFQNKPLSFQFKKILKGTGWPITAYNYRLTLRAHSRGYFYILGMKTRSPDCNSCQLPHGDRTSGAPNGWHSVPAHQVVCQLYHPPTGRRTHELEVNWKPGGDVSQD